MNITQEKIDQLNAVIKVKISPTDYQERVEKAIKEQAKKAKIPGFRPGMVPAAHIKKMYGKSILVDEINTLLSDTVNNYLTDNKIEVLGQPLPKVTDTKEPKWDFNDEFEFDYELGLAPEFDLSFSAKDKLPFYQIKVDKDTLASRTKNLRRSYGKMTNPEIADNDDVLFGELKQLAKDGSVYEGGFGNDKASIRLDLVSDAKIKKALVGLKKEAVVNIDLNKAFNGDAAQLAKLLNVEEEAVRGLKSDFQFTVKNINRLEEADLTQEFFDKLFGKDTVKTEKEFEAKITEELESMMQQNAEQRLQNDLYKFGTEKAKFKLPDAFLKRWLKATNENLSDAEIEADYNNFAQNLKWTLIENKIIKENNIEIKYEDVFQTAKARLDGQFRMYSPQPLPEEQLAQYTVQFLQNKENANRIFDEVKALKVFDYLKSVVTLDKKDIAYNKFLELA